MDKICAFHTTGNYPWADLRTSIPMYGLWIIGCVLKVDGFVTITQKKIKIVVVSYI